MNQFPTISGSFRVEWRLNGVSTTYHLWETVDTIYKINDKEFEYIAMAIGVLPILENEPISRKLEKIPRRIPFEWCFYD